MIIPDLPQEIRDDFVIHAASELQRQAPWLFAAMIANSVIAMLTASPNVGWFVQYGLPCAMATFSLVTALSLRRNLQFSQKPWRANKFLVQATLSSCFGALICTTWCVLSWIHSPIEARMHFPIILIVGALATAYCLSNIKVGALINLVIDMVPIAALMILSGHPTEFAAAVSLLLAGGFQIRMIDSHHARMVNLLQLRHAADTLARTDPLTGLQNRRALLDKAADLGSTGAPLRLVLVDIDRFKTINDDHGHNVGDEVLRRVGAILSRHNGDGIVAARIGGEEFALIGLADAMPGGLPLAVLGDVRACIMPHGGQVTASIGVAQGLADCEDGWEALFARADTALYGAKGDGRNRVREDLAPETATRKEFSVVEAA